MSITDELRKAADDIASTAVPCGASPDYIGVRRKIAAIADRIDAEHESACAEAYGNGVMSVPIALDESAWVKLPVDADGVPIRIGDVMETDNGIREVDVLQKSSRKWSVGLVPVGSGAFSGAFSWHDAETLHHHHAPTVEDVLREFADEFNRDDTELCDEEIIERFAAKLRLAGDVE